MNQLREELKTIRGRIQDYQVAKQTSEDRDVHSVDALIQTLNADAGLWISFTQQNECVWKFR